METTEEMKLGMLPFYFAWEATLYWRAFYIRTPILVIANLCNRAMAPKIKRSLKVESLYSAKEIAL